MTNSERNNTNFAISNAEPRPFNSAVVSIENIQHQDKLSTASLSSENAKLRSALAFMPLGLTMLDDQDRLLLCNQQWIDIWDTPAHLTRRGTPITEIMANDVKEEISFSGDTTIGEIGQKEREFTTRNGRVVQVLVHVLPDHTVIALHRDVTDERKADARISYLAKYDTLTKLRNRAALNERLEELLALEQPHHSALFNLGLDGFKKVNDTLGHPIGDKLLCMVAATLRSCCKQSDLVCRLGSDEFAIVMTDARPDNSVEKLADDIIESLSGPIHIDGRLIHTGISIGITRFSNKNISADELVQKSDLALYHAKSAGGGVARFFEKEMETRAQNRRKLESDLHHALLNNEFELYYQPQIDLKTMQVCGAEALIRWNHPTRGMIGPNDFIPVAEESGQIVAIGSWVIKQACREAMQWPGSIKVAVNVSAVQCGKSGAPEVDLLNDVKDALAQSKLPADRLELEITETVIMQDINNTRTLLDKLKQLGIQIAVDDFGTGYSSMQYLRSYPFDRLKIDRSFVMNIDSDADALSIIRAVVDLANNLGVTTTAEGVETQDQLRVIQHLGCDKVQGYLFGRPCPAKDFRALTARGSLGSNIYNAA